MNHLYAVWCRYERGDEAYYRIRAIVAQNGDEAVGMLIRQVRSDYPDSVVTSTMVALASEAQLAVVAGRYCAACGEEKAGAK